MDPSACYQRFMDALIERDLPELMEAMIDLSGWLNAGGYEPEQWANEGITVKDWWGLTTVLSSIVPDNDDIPAVHCRSCGEEWL